MNSTNENMHINLKLQSRVDKMKLFCIIFKKYLHMSKKSSTFAPDLINKCLTI